MHPAYSIHLAIPCSLMPYFLRNRSEYAYKTFGLVYIILSLPPPLSPSHTHKFSLRVSFYFHASAHYNFHLSSSLVFHSFNFLHSSSIIYPRSYLRTALSTLSVWDTSVCEFLVYRTCSRPTLNLQFLKNLPFIQKLQYKSEMFPTFE